MKWTLTISWINSLKMKSASKPTGWSKTGKQEGRGMDSFLTLVGRKDIWTSETQVLAETHPLTALALSKVDSTC